MTYTNTFQDSVRGCFSWTPGVLDTGLHILTFVVKDSNCVANGVPISQAFTYPVYIWPYTKILKDTTICPGDSTHLLAVGGGNFSWGVLPGGSPLSTLSCTTCKNPTARPTVTTRYTVFSGINNGICNHNRDTVTITVAQVPVFNLGPDTSTCVNNSIQFNTHLQPVTGISYHIKWTPSTWLSNDTISNPIGNPLLDTSYVVTITPNGQSRCASKDTIRVAVLQGFALYNKDTAVCKGATININASGDPRYTYAWTPTNGVASSTILNTSITADTSRTYTVKATHAGCRDSSQKFYIDVQPTITVYAGPDRTLCYNDTIHLDQASATPPYPLYTYSWSPGGGLNDASTLHPIFTALQTSTLTLTVTTPAGCKGSDDVTITVVPAKFLTISADTALCPGDSATLHVTGTAATIRWTPVRWINFKDSLNPIVKPITTTIYTVHGQDLNHCVDTENVMVTVRPAATINLPDSVTIFSGESYQMDPTGNCLYFTWFPPLGLSNAAIANPVAIPEVNTRYYVNGSTEAGCTANDSIVVMVNPETYIDVPNAFTPGSGANGILYPVHRGNATLNSFKIYNRWGTKVFESHSLDAGWDGMYNDTPQPLGVYVYVVDAVTPSGRHFYKQGNVTLLR